jgi:phosphotriesterase-related protein
MSTIRTVLGDIEPADLGPCTAHEHLFLDTPTLPGEELVDPAESEVEAAALVAAGAAALVDWTPIALGRRPRDLEAVSRSTGLHVVACTGYHHEGHYRQGHWVRREPVRVLAELAERDLTAGMDEADWCGPRERPTVVRAGAVKLGAGYHAASTLERRFFEAGAQAARAAGAPVCVHTEHGTFALEALALLAEHGVPASQVVLAHLDRNPDPGLHAEVAAAGAWIEYDGPGRARLHPDASVLALIAEMAARGHADRLLLGTDTARRSSLRTLGGGPGLDYLFRRFRPRVRQELGDDLDHRLFVANPAAAFALR